MELPEENIKPIRWVGSSKEDLVEFPREVRGVMGHALYLAQIGMKSPQAKPLHGFGGTGVLEIVEDHDGNAYRAVYTVKFKGMIVVLHAFQKKSKKGISTPKADIDLIHARLKTATEFYNRHRRNKP